MPKVLKMPQCSSLYNPLTLFWSWALRPDLRGKVCFLSLPRVWWSATKPGAAPLSTLSILEDVRNRMWANKSPIRVSHRDKHLCSWDAQTYTRSDDQVMKIGYESPVRRSSEAPHCLYKPLLNQLLGIIALQTVVRHVPIIMKFHLCHQLASQFCHGGKSTESYVVTVSSQIFHMNTGI